MGNIINLTPHPVVVCDEAGKPVVTFQPTGKVARARQIDTKVGELEVVTGFKVDVVSTSYGEPEDLPAPQDGIYYVVSILTAQAAKASGRTIEDLLITSDPVRGPDGKIIGCKKFAHI